MTWTRLSDDFPDRPAMLDASRSARLLHVEALVYCNRHLTDGRITKAALPRITDATDAQRDVAELEAAGLWTAIDEQTWQIDWTDQEQAVVVRERQEAQAAKQRLYRRRLALHRAGDHTICRPTNCKAVTGNAPGNEIGDETQDVAPPGPSLPGPSRPEGAGTGRGRPRCSHGLPLAADGEGCPKCADPRSLRLAGER